MPNLGYEPGLHRNYKYCIQIKLLIKERKFCTLVSYMLAYYMIASEFKLQLYHLKWNKMRANSFLGDFLPEVFYQKLWE